MFTKTTKNGTLFSKVNANLGALQWICIEKCRKLYLIKGKKWCFILVFATWIHKASLYILIRFPNRKRKSSYIRNPVKIWTAGWEQELTIPKHRES